ncbi:myotubularin-related protein 9 [Microplitis mediator]|uniref:myotubularin-related protein 9 n=1 Tax=Microplitis mediator TaxID=375433 RepID=UPI0025557FEE|nr:myotubularin-related protein 9 [Microplitis mediator]
MEFFDMIPVAKVECVVLTEKTNEKQSRLEGTLCLSDHHLLLSFREESRKDLWLLYRNIDVIEKKTNNQIPGGSIILKCKDFRILQLDFINTDDLISIATSLEKLSSLDQTLQYPFFFRPQTLNQNKDQSENGWTAFTPVSEWSRLLASHGDEWRVSYLNRDYKVCNSYPSTLIVPRLIDDQMIISSAGFREGGRFPVLCYRHEGGSILFRSGQPLCGATGKRCKEDERLLNIVLGSGRRGYIIDTRSSSQAQSARARGGGTEIDSAYPQWRKVFKSVPRLSDLAESLSKLIEACNDISCSTSQWLSRLENSGWLSTVQSAMNAACVAAQCLHQELAAVLVHGGAGRDSTLVITSLAQIILNPDCRTVRGFEALLEREWVQAGHPFYTRTRHGAYYPTNSQHSPHAPTFLLFLDCLYQLHYQFQFSFEYTTEMLIELFKHAYFSGYGTFLGDSESDRISLRLAERTTSIWAYINKSESLEKWLNPLYEPNPGVIWPSVAPISINLWKELYLSHTSASPWSGFTACVTQIKHNHSSVKKVANQLRIQVRRALDDIICDQDTSCQTENDQEQLSPCFAQLTLESQKT